MNKLLQLLCILIAVKVIQLKYKREYMQNHWESFEWKRFPVC